MEENINEEEIKEMQNYFDKEVWARMKKEVKDMTKRESCFFSFLAGSQMMKQINNMQNENLGKELEEMEKKMKSMSGDEIKEMLEEDNNNLWENKTKINGVWVDDKTGEELDET